MSEPRLVLEVECQECGGTGEGRWLHDAIGREPCPTCNGSGGSRRVLDPEEVVLRGREILASDVGKTLMHATVQDIIEALAALEGRE